MNKIENLSDVRDIIQENNWKIFGVGGLPLTRSEIYPFVKDFELICSNKSGEFESVEKKIKINFFDLKIHPKSKKPEKILENKNVVDYIKKTTKNKKVGIYVTKSSRKLENICLENGWVPICAEESLFDKFDDRLFFYEILKKIGLNKNFEICKSSDLKTKLEKFFLKFGKKVVIQSLLGAGGRGTFFIGEKDDLSLRIKEIKDRLEILGGNDSAPLIVTSFIEGYDVGIMGCVTSENGILTGYPRYQMIDIQESVQSKSNGKGVFCGHDWSFSNNISQKICQQAEIYAEKIGKELKRKGYLGIFGVDFILNKNKTELFPLEVNPRLLGSFPFEIQIQMDNNEVPLTAFHLLEFLKIKYKIADKNVYKKNQKREGAHLLVFNFWGKDVKFKKSLKGGVYNIKKGKLIFLRNGFEIHDIKDSEKEFILTEGLPQKDSISEKNRKLFRIVFKRSILGKDGKKILSKDRKKIVLLKKYLETLLKKTNFEK